MSAAGIKKPRSLKILRDFETGQVFVKYGEAIVENIIGFQVVSGELGTVATLVFPVGDIEIEEVESQLKRVFGGTMEANAGVMPGGN